MTIAAGRGTALESISSAGTGLRVQFEWSGDRFEHRISATEPPRRFSRSCARSVDLLQSVSGDLAAVWPLSPPLQELNESLIRSDQHQGQVGFLVGGTSAGHWSLCVDVAEVGEGQLPRLLFDVACRAKTRPKTLASTYSLSRGAVVSSCDGKVDISTSTGVVRLEPLSLSGTVDPRQPRIDSSPTEISIVLPIPDTSIAPFTYRWRYQWTRLG